MNREGLTRGVVGAAVCLALLLGPRTGAADEKYALWGDFIYTLYSGQKVIWVVAPAFRTAAQAVNGRFTTRISTALTYDLAPGWDLRGQFFLIGRQAEVGETAFDQRAQILLRYTLFRFHDDEIRVRGGTFYERHFRGDAVEDFNVYRQRFELRADPWRWVPGIH